MKLFTYIYCAVWSIQEFQFEVKSYEGTSEKSTLGTEQSILEALSSGCLF